MQGGMDRHAYVERMDLMGQVFFIMICIKWCEALEQQQQIAFILCPSHSIASQTRKYWKISK